MQLPRFSSLISTFLLAATAVKAALNGPCTANGTPGVCVSTASCRSAGGTSHKGFCPNDPPDIQCCTKTSCGSSGGNCRWTSQCAGTTKSNLCPGPDTFKCCEGSKPPGTVTIPTNRCKPHVVTNGYVVLRQFPGVINTVHCYGTRSGPSDHPLGLALDFMHRNRDPIGQRIGEWVMNNASRLKVKYVISGQRIWETRNSRPKPWAQWERMDNRGSDTANHWDHVHVSFFA